MERIVCEVLEHFLNQMCCGMIIFNVAVIFKIMFEREHLFATIRELCGNAFEVSRIYQTCKQLGIFG